MWVPSSLTLVLSLDYCVCNNFNGFVFLMDINCVVWEVETVYRYLCMCVCMCVYVYVCVYMYVCMYVYMYSRVSFYDGGSFSNN